MNATERWTWRQVESNVDKYGGRQIAGAHNKLVDICAGLQAELAAVSARLVRQSLQRGETRDYNEYRRQLSYAILLYSRLYSNTPDESGD